MFRERAVFIVLTVVAVAAASASDGTVDAARAERERLGRLRHHAVVIGNEELGAASGEASLGHVSPTGTAAATPLAPDDAASASAAAPPETAAEAKVARALRELEAELEWRERMAAARAQIQELHADLDYARQRLLVLRLGLVVPLNAMAEYKRKPDIDLLMARVAYLERSLADARLAPARIRDEARRQRIPPGWVR